MGSDELLEAKVSFVAEIDGRIETVTAGRTRVRAGHRLHQANPNAWKPLEIRGDGVEQATAAPGEKRGRPDKASEKPAGV